MHGTMYGTMYEGLQATLSPTKSGGYAPGICTLLYLGEHQAAYSLETTPLYQSRGCYIRANSPLVDR